jgi:hypothetical protein
VNSRADLMSVKPPAFLAMFNNGDLGPSQVPLIGAIPGIRMLVLGMGQHVAPRWQDAEHPVFIDLGPFRQPPSKSGQRGPILIVIAMDVAIILAFIGYSLYRGLVT